MPYNGKALLCDCGCGRKKKDEGTDSRRGSWHPLSAGDQGAAEGDAARGRPPRYSICGRRRGLASAADEVVIINSHEKKAIEDHFSPNPELVALLRERGKDKYADVVEKVGDYNVSYVYQEEALGLGHAVRCAAEKTGDEPFYVLLGDVLVPDNKMLPAMQEVSDAHGGASVIAVMPVPDEEVSRFGVIAGEAVSDDVWKIDSLVEKPALEDAPSNLAVFGRYLLSPRVMELLADVKPGVGGEIQLTDALDAVLKEEEMYALVIDPADGFDTEPLKAGSRPTTFCGKRAQGE